MQVYRRLQDVIYGQNLQSALLQATGPYYFWRFFSPEFNILVTGLDCCGKTTLLRSLATGEIEATIPRIGLNIETIHFRNIHFTAWDVGGSCKPSYYLPLRPLLFTRAKAIIFVVDTNDRDRILEVGEELQRRILEEDESDLKRTRGFLESWLQQDGSKRTEQDRIKLLEGKLLDSLPILVLMNKQDINGAMSVGEIEEKLSLKTRLKGRQYRVQPCSLKNRTGLYEGLQWLSNEIGQWGRVEQEKQPEMILIEKRKDSE